MPNSYFKFKQFTIWQKKTSMKVGTDGVLLGAWANCTSAKKALDIGTGTGLIALMLAQRNTQLNIDAIEIEKEAFIEAKKNCDESPWSDRVCLFNTSLQNFTSNIKYDLIVSNPPFFESSIKNQSNAKALARHTDSLSYAELISNTDKLLSEEGIFCVIIPYDSSERFIKISDANNLFLNKKVQIKGTEKAQIKRVLLEFSRVKKGYDESELIIEESRHQYTPEFIALLKDFYLYL